MFNETWTNLIQKFNLRHCKVPALQKFSQKPILLTSPSAQSLPTSSASQTPYFCKPNPRKSNFCCFSHIPVGKSISKAKFSPHINRLETFCWPYRTWPAILSSLASCGEFERWYVTDKSCVVKEENAIE